MCFDVNFRLLNTIYVDFLVCYLNCNMWVNGKDRKITSVICFIVVLLM